MINFFKIVIIIFIGILLLVLKKRSFEKLINKSNLNSIKLNKNNNFSSNKNSFLYNYEEKKNSVFYKILNEIKCLVSFRLIQKIN